MLLSTTSVIGGKQITKVHGLVSGEAILGANIFRDLFATPGTLGTSGTSGTLFHSAFMTSCAPMMANRARIASSTTLVVQ